MISLDRAGEKRQSVEKEITQKSQLVALKAAPEKGHANNELISLLAGFFGVPRTDVEITAGGASRNKKVLIRDRSLKEIERAIQELDTGA